MLRLVRSVRAAPASAGARTPATLLAGGAGHHLRRLAQPARRWIAATTGNAAAQRTPTTTASAAAPATAPTAATPYLPGPIESKWQAYWSAQQEQVASSHSSDADRLLRSKKPPFYALAMFPYPSGALHMGHVRVYTISDTVSRWMRMRGFEVFHPMGWDAFGLPAENAAIERGISPATWTKQNIRDMRQQMAGLGCQFDWAAEVATCDPEYYKWTQWIFTQLHEKGLAYQSDAGFVNWDPVDCTVLANEQVDSEGRSWRSGALVEKKKLKQWFVRVTEYADPLLTDLDKLAGWPHQVKTMQRNWIGKSTGTRVVFSVRPTSANDAPEATPSPVSLELPVFTTRLDTLHGVTFLAVHLSPQERHALLVEAEARGLLAQDRLDAIQAYQEEMAQLNDVDRSTSKSGVFTGLYAVHPLDSSKTIPIYGAAYVLADYATGAVMGVPAHDARDAAFAKVHGLESKVVVVPAGAATGETDLVASAPSTTLTTTEGVVLVNSPGFDGLTPAAASAAMLARLSSATSPVTSSPVAASQSLYRLKDWLVSRQRYWGAPIPIIHCEHGCGAVAVPLKDLPVVLPDLARLNARGGSPLASTEDPIAVAWRKCSCPKCGRSGRRETDTLDTFVDSSWYFLRYFSPHSSTQAFSPEIANRFIPTPIYIGGIEHAILHLLYARFLTRFFHTSLGLLQSPEPFAHLLTQGMVHGETFKHPRTGKFVRPDQVKFEIEGGGTATDGVGKENKKKPYLEETDVSTGVVTRTPLQVVWEKMSKSKYNGVEPTAVTRVWGVDCIRLFTLFKAPPSQVLDWEEGQIKGQQRFIQRVWNGVQQHAAATSKGATKQHQQQLQQSIDFATLSPAGQALFVHTNDAITGVSLQLEDRIFNVAIALLMKLVNQTDDFLTAAVKEGMSRQDALASPVYHHALSTLVLLLAPMTPHLSAECWELLVALRYADAAPVPKELAYVHEQAWPLATTTALTSSTITAVLMVGKSRIGQVDINSALRADSAKFQAAVLATPLATQTFKGKTIKRVVVVPQKNNPSVVILNVVAV